MKCPRTKYPKKNGPKPPQSPEETGTNADDSDELPKKVEDMYGKVDWLLKQTDYYNDWNQEYQYNDNQYDDGGQNGVYEDKEKGDKDEPSETECVQADLILQTTVALEEARAEVEDLRK
ncbi:hypothetical protein ETB97_002692 [Aspergillus alliaceus]|uniref:Uncharacterized protein n=1 Tax=Petromyces alliaceus TaxID=209559 RepID=A0A5N6G0L0_PETAA|nr:uncharacterized protein BDW43DRAFT_309460 [Aspergillus alliaceus]KAB8235079.1 hypothetical protein BDW43DRAFT_309460 [Aspergillus alliaceus]KAF5865717.1 hypothetical protein ETB97_002692 [Aspergillus burnettii]